MVARGVRVYDPWLIVVSVVLTVFGITLIYSGSYSRLGGAETVLRGPVGKQVLFLAAGLVLMTVFARLDYRGWSTVAFPAYAGALAMLVIVMVIGSSEYGSRRWITIAGFDMQPSEPAKLATILLLAKLLSGGGVALPGRVFLLSLVVAAGPALLVFKQPDLGTAIVFMTVWLGMVYIAGASGKQLGLLTGVGLVALPFVLLVAVHGYQKDRLAIFFNPDRDPLGTGFNINQAAISIGSGGWFGKGLTNGTQTQLDFLRTQTTDYIFSVLGEELGFIDAMLLFALFIVLLLLGIRAVSRSLDPFGRLVATGIVVMILTQVFVNIGVNVRLFPVTGIPLPFVSQGGSSLVSMFIAVGLLESILMRHRPSRFRAPSRERLLLPG